MASTGRICPREFVTHCISLALQTTLLGDERREPSPMKYGRDWGPDVVEEGLGREKASVVAGEVYCSSAFALNGSAI